MAETENCEACVLLLENEALQRKLVELEARIELVELVIAELNKMLLKIVGVIDYKT